MRRRPSGCPKPPEDILNLKVADPACGSGTFPLAALRFLTDALYLALQHHGRIEPEGDAALVHLLRLNPDETHTGARLGDELIPCRIDADEFEPRLKAVLRRHVVERCLYAVDVDPLAVELCRLSLWIETMDRTLPFGFLDHKVKCGNALIGAWFDEFAHYPAMAWKNRDGGDRGHNNGVHFAKNARTQALKTFVKERLTPDLALFLRGQDLFQPDLLQDATATHAGGLERALHHARHARAGRRHPCANLPRRVRRLANVAAPEDRHGSMVRLLVLATERTRLRPAAEDVRDTRSRDASRGEALGEDAPLLPLGAGVPGCVRWKRLRPGSARGLPLARKSGRIRRSARQSAVGHRQAGFQGVLLQHRSPLPRLRQAGGAAQANRVFPATRNRWSGRSARATGGAGLAGLQRPLPRPIQLHQPRRQPLRRPGREHRHPEPLRRSQRPREPAPARQLAQERAKATGFADPSHPFRHQGSADLNLYKLFLEAAHALLKSGGRLGFVVPSGLYSDNGTGALRRLFLEHCRWEWLFGIENKDAVFPIHRSYKFNPVIVQKSATTDAIRTAFMRRNLDDWERAETLATPLARAQVARFSPRAE